MYLFVGCFFVPMINSIVVVQIHRSAIYNPSSSCVFLRNRTGSTESSVDACIWECVYETNCQTAVYFRNEKICSLFTESCQSENIVSAGNIQASVICYPKDQGKSLSLLFPFLKERVICEKFTLKTHNVCLS